LRLRAIPEGFTVQQVVRRRIRTACERPGQRGGGTAQEEENIHPVTIRDVELTVVVEIRRIQARRGIAAQEQEAQDEDAVGNVESAEEIGVTTTEWDGSKRIAASVLVGSQVHATATRAPELIEVRGRGSQGEPGIDGRRPGLKAKVFAANEEGVRVHVP